MKLKLLIVDDSRVSRMIIKAKTALLQPNWEIFEAASGDEAVAAVVSQQPDFITMDINMPGINGFEAVAQIRSKGCQAKIAMLTANIQDSSRAQARQLAVHFVPKPVTELAIQQAVDYFLVPL